MSTSNAVVVSHGTKRGQTISHTTKQTDYSNHYTTFTSGPNPKVNSDGLRTSDVMTVGSQELNSTQNQKTPDTVNTSDIRAIKLNYLQ